mgnify:CR=1 FL=1
MYLTTLVQKQLFKLKYRKNISNLFNATGYKDIFIGKNTIIKDFASLQAHRGNSKGKINIGEKSNIGEFSKILAGSGVVTIGDNVSARSKLTLLGGGNINIGNNVLISHNVVISSSSHDFTVFNMLVTNTPSVFKPINIADNVFIGANSTILMGCTIHAGAIIGAGSVVTENTTIGKNEIWYGNPAKLQNTRVPIKEQIEIEIVNYLEKYPFHNIFLLYNLENVFASEFGGTCSDRTSHFMKILNKKIFANNIDIKLHIAEINSKKTHTILRVNIQNRVYFCDIGMGFPITKLLPADENIKFTSYGIDFKTKVNNNRVTLFINQHDEIGEHELMCIDTKIQSETMINDHLNSRSEYIKDLPLSKKLRYFFIYDGKFYQIK